MKPKKIKKPDHTAEQFTLAPLTAGQQTSVKIGGVFQLDGDFFRLWKAYEHYHASINPSVAQRINGLVRIGLETWGKSKGLL